MRSPWTALRTSQEQIRNETDERAELVQLRRRCLELRAVVVAGGLGMVTLLGRPLGLRDASGATWSGAVLVLAVALLAVWLVARAIGRRRYGMHVTPERDRAETVRALLLLPLLVVVAGATHWWVGGDLADTGFYVVVLAIAMGAGLGLRLWSIRKPTPGEDRAGEM
ncbi:hypothetical protein FVA95_23590 [Pseudonocardia sp. EV170527-09]|uniref:hypothetical protein n=1 Tax=Pseudonocardia sp. EV170527-09 TaxID=2603411 RepID=UPI0011F1BD59|nr:hypothetical protein [Pseudonocardia sp. EV170527-09]KAA1018381.1 hypothetical protein FVA95_23590 [Pseudonocardia sp. EV170527-09]